MNLFVRTPRSGGGGGGVAGGGGEGRGLIGLVGNLFVMPNDGEAVGVHAFPGFPLHDGDFEKTEPISTRRAAFV